MTKATRAVVSGDVSTGADEPSSREPELRWTDKPILVFVCDEASGCEGFDKIENIVLKDEKVALAMKAFRTLKMHPDHVAADPILEGRGRDVPRMILIDPTKMKIRVLESKKVKPSSLYSAMKKTAKGFWKESLDNVVKKHLKLMVEQDKLAKQLRTLQDKKQRLDEGEERKASEIAAEIEQVEAERNDLRAKKAELWKLTPKDEAA